MLKKFSSLRAENMTAGQRWAALAMLTGGLLVIMMDMTILIMALPDLVAELAASAAQQLWVVDIYSLVLAGLLIPMSAVADRWGRRRMLMVGFSIFGLVSVLVLVADSIAAVIALRALLGAAGAMIMPTTLSMIRSIFLIPAERARALAVWSLVAGLGAVLGPLVGGTLLQFFSWHFAFLVNVPFVVAALIAGMLFLPEVRVENPPRWDLLATVLAMGGMFTLVWGIKSMANEGWSHLPSWGFMAVGAALLISFVVRCLRSAHPLIDVRLFRSKPFTAAIVAALTSSLALGGVMLLEAQWLQMVIGFSPFMTGLALLPMAVGAVLTAPFAPALAGKIGTRVVLMGGLGVAGFGLLGLYLQSPLVSYWQAVIPVLLVGAGVGSLAIASAIIMGSTPVEKAGNAAALEEAMYDVGNVLGITVLGSIAAAVYRSGLAVQENFSAVLEGAALTAANESVAGALAVSLAGNLPELGRLATDSFLDGFGTASLIGSIILLFSAVIVFRLMPRRFDLNQDH